jgi:hypothetical protein
MAKPGYPLGNELRINPLPTWRIGWRLNVSENEIELHRECGRREQQIRQLRRELDSALKRLTSTGPYPARVEQATNIVKRALTASDTWVKARD